MLPVDLEYSGDEGYVAVVVDAACILWWLAGLAEDTAASSDVFYERRSAGDRREAQAGAAY